jgi:hypothetical protein
VGASGRRSALTSNEVARRTGGQVSGWSGDDTSGSNGRSDDGGEGDHFERKNTVEVEVLFVESDAGKWLTVVRNHEKDDSGRLYRFRQVCG